jgi:hypothetical protein
MGQPVPMKLVHPERSGSEPGELKHLSIRRKRKQKSDSLSSGDRTGNSPNRNCFGKYGVEGPREILVIRSGSFLERGTVGGESPVRVRVINIRGILSKSGHEKS